MWLQLTVAIDWLRRLRGRDNNELPSGLVVGAGQEDPCPRLSASERSGEQRAPRRWGMDLDVRLMLDVIWTGLSRNLDCIGEGLGRGSYSVQERKDNSQLQCYDIDIYM